MTLPPTPAHILRGHAHAISALWLSTDNLRLYSGDGSGRVMLTSTRTLRALATWQAHTDSILGLEEWGTTSQRILITSVRVFHAQVSAEEC
jgi:ASTRA-associated protein 1